MESVVSSLVDFFTGEKETIYAKVASNFGRTVLFLYTFNYFPYYHAVLHGIHKSESVRKRLDISGHRSFMFTLVVLLLSIVIPPAVQNLPFGKSIYLFKDPHILPIMVACWYLVLYSPFDIVYRVVNSNVVSLVIMSYEVLKRSRSIASVFSKVSNAWGAEYWWAQVIFGTLAGSSGSLFIHFVALLNGRSEQKKVTDIVRIPFYWSLMYLFISRNSVGNFVGTEISMLEVSQFALTVFFLEYYLVNLLISNIFDPFYYMEVVLGYLLFYLSPRAKFMKKPLPKGQKPKSKNPPVKPAKPAGKPNGKKQPTRGEDKKNR